MKPAVSCCCKPLSLLPGLLSITLLSITLFSAFPALAQPEASSEIPLVADPSLAPPKTTAEAIILLARSGNLNVIADATEFDKQPKNLNDKQTSKHPNQSWGLVQGTLPQRLHYLREAHNLTQFQVDQNMFLFWTPPDVQALAQRLADGESISPIEAPPARENQTLAGDLAGYWQVLQNENIGVEEFFREGKAIRVALHQVPTPLRQSVMFQAQHQLLQSSANSGWAAWFNEEFWKSARLQMRVLDHKPPQPPPALAAKFKEQNANRPQPAQPAPPPQQVLFLTGKYTDPQGRRGTAMLSLGVRELPPDSNTPPLHPTLHPTSQPPTQTAVQSPSRTPISTPQK